MVDTDSIELGDPPSFANSKELNDVAGPNQEGLPEIFARLGIVGAILAAILGLVVAIFCFFVPGLHFILGPFGPFFGGLVGGHLTGGGISRVALVATLITLGMTAIAAAFTGLIFGDEVESALAKAAPIIAFGYTAFFSTIGAAIGGLFGGGGQSPPVRAKT